jgi:hypothetical protein
LQSHAVVELSALIRQAGVCRHRALLYKYLADHSVRFPSQWGISVESMCLPIRARLVRGSQANEPHAWNVVFVDKKHYLLDVMQDPFALHDVSSQRVSQFLYQRIESNGNGKARLLHAFTLLLILLIVNSFL